MTIKRPSDSLKSNPIVWENLESVNHFRSYPFV